MFIFGQNGTGATDFTDCWDQNTVRTLPTTAVKLGVSSADAKDTAAGDGGRTIKIAYLASTYAYAEETLSLNGQTKVETTGLALRVLSAEVLTVGSELDNAGIIYIYDTSDTVTAGVPQTATKIFGRISAGDNVMRIGMFTVPLGETWRILKLAAYQRDASATLRYGMVRLQYREPGGVWLPVPLQSFSSDTKSELDFTNMPDMALSFSEKTDVRVQADLLEAAPWGCTIWYDKW
jgi:hypothetical protein